MYIYIYRSYCHVNGSCDSRAVVSYLCGYDMLLRIVLLVFWTTGLLSSVQAYNNGTSSTGKVWALLLAGSNGYGNYRHQVLNYA